MRMIFNEQEMARPYHEIIEASSEWADRYRLFCQRAYEAAYTSPELGLTSDLFSIEVFSSPRITRYFRDLVRTTTDHGSWLALDGTRRILGGAVAHRYPEFCEMRSFYVAPERKGQGIGGALYRRVLSFAGVLPIQVDVVEHMQATIEMYERWGFVLDESKGVTTYPWEEWPESSRLAYKGVYMVKPGSGEKR